MRRIERAAVLLLAACLGGCLAGGEFRPTHFYAVDSEAAEAAAAETLPASATLRRFTSVSRYGQRMIRRSSAVELDYDEYHRWADMPEELVSDALCRRLQERRVFRSLSGPDLELPADATIEGRLLVFEQDVERHAVCSVALVVRRSSDQGVLWSGIVTGRKRVAGTTASDLARAMALALDEVADRCAAEWRKIEALRAPGESK